MRTDMKNLSERVTEGMSEAERCDILWNLLRRVEDGKTTGSDPYEILLDENGDIHISPSTGGMNLAWQAPEWIRAFTRGNSPPVGKSQGWFFMGMLAYYLYYGTGYYAAHGLRLMDMDAFTYRQDSVIRENEAEKIPFARAVEALTAVVPEKRRNGVGLFLRHLENNLPGQAEVRFFSGGIPVGNKIYPLEGQDHDNLIPEGVVTLAGKRYRLSGPLKVPYRALLRRYDVTVTPEISPVSDNTGSGQAVVHFLLNGQEIHCETYPLKGANCSNLIPRGYIWVEKRRYNLSGPLRVTPLSGVHHYNAEVSPYTPPVPPGRRGGRRI